MALHSNFSESQVSLLCFHLERENERCLLPWVRKLRESQIEETKRKNDLGEQTSLFRKSEGCET